MNDPLISIIVPVYNAQDFLAQCVESILAQTYDHLEVMLVDDGSTDASGAMCDAYATKDSRVRVIHKENGHHISARKAGLGISHGEYIGWVDSDDWIDPDMYEKLYRAMRDHNVDIAICNLAVNYYGQEKRNKQYYPPGLYNKERLLREVYPTMLRNEHFGSAGLDLGLVTKLYARKLLDANLPLVDDRIYNYGDAACSIPPILDAERVYFLDGEYLYHYRQTSQQMSRKYRPEFFQRSMILCEFLQGVSDRKQVFDLTPQIHRMIQFFAVTAAEFEFGAESSISYWEKFNHLKTICNHPDVIAAFKVNYPAKMITKYRVYTFLIKNRLTWALFLSMTAAQLLRNLLSKSQGENSPRFYTE